MPGWTAYTWGIELKRKAECCQRDHPDIAEAYRTWEQNIKGEKRDP